MYKEKRKKVVLITTNRGRKFWHPGVIDYSILYSSHRIFIKNVIILSGIGQTSPTPETSLLLGFTAQ